MAVSSVRGHTVGWIGTGRMGFQIAQRLLAGGCDLAVWNRTRSKAEPLAEHGATIVDSPADLADRELVFTHGRRTGGLPGGHHRAGRSAVA